MLPVAALDACAVVTGPHLQWEGDFVQASEPTPWQIPDRVFYAGGVVIIMPVGQPPGTDECNGGALFSAHVETGNYIRETDCRITEPVKWWNAAERLREDGGEDATAINAGLLLRAAQAASTIEPNDRWHFLSHGSAVVMLTHARPDVVIVIMKMRPETAPELPEWAFSPEAFAHDAAKRAVAS